MRPQFAAGLAPIGIKQARHPLLDALHGCECVPSDLFLSDEQNVQLVSGVNMSGKSTLLRTAALLVVLAHVGSFVPAAWCSLRVVERLRVRLGDDSAVAAVATSSFSQECEQVATALRDADERSLVLIDELGRSTATGDGVAIAWAVAEHLAHRTRALVLFVTHFAELQRLAALYDTVRLCHMRVERVPRAHGGGTALRSHFQLTDGPNDIASYGIDVARDAGLPPAMVCDSASHVEAADGARADSSRAPDSRAHRRGQRAHTRRPHRRAQRSGSATRATRGVGHAVAVGSWQAARALTRRRLRSALRHSSLSLSAVRAYLRTCATDYAAVLADKDNDMDDEEEEEEEDEEKKETTEKKKRRRKQQQQQQQ